MSLSLIAIISDGIIGHVSQSRGVAKWLARESGAEVVEVEIPKLTGLARTMSRLRARYALAHGVRRSARDWLEASSYGDVLDRVSDIASERGIAEGDRGRMLLLSAGTSAALVNIAVGYIWRCSCATLMTPSVIGTEPFDMAIVPEHDCPRPASNVMTTLGAPNVIDRAELEAAAAPLLREHPSQGGHRWAVLIGGSDANYRVTPELVRTWMDGLAREADERGGELYITTSRRTPIEAETVLKRSAERCGAVRYLQISSEDPRPTMPALLGACEEVFVTDDSVNMISETVTSGRRAVLLRTDRVGGARGAVSRATAALCRAGVLPERFLWGVPRFDAAIERFKASGRVVEWEDRRTKEAAPDGDFCEARRAAAWMIKRLREIS